MSGTSLDGVDIAYCEFTYDLIWRFKIIRAATIEYNPYWFDLLSKLHESDAKTLILTHIKYGQYLGQITMDFIKTYNLLPDFIASHGHTIFHQPENGLTLQIGDGNAIAAVTGIPVIYNFRSLDVANGGHGAPLVPIGDRLLFGEFDYCLNLGGIANISYESGSNRIAFDICPVNMVLNFLAAKKGLKFDIDGKLSVSGKINLALLNELNQLDFCSFSPPKSLGREYVERSYFPLLNSDFNSVQNTLRTVTEHIVFQLAEILNKLPPGKLLITGGGAKNKFLIERLKNKIQSEVILPETVIIDYKEALIFAFLGVLRWNNQVNCLSSVTGAKRDSCSGVIVHF